MATPRLLILLLVACGSSADVSSPAVASDESSLCTSHWRWDKQGLVSGLPESVLSPAVVVDGGSLHLWFAQKNGLVYRLHHALSQDAGASFTDVVEADGLGESTIIAYPTVWREDDGFHMIYGSGSLYAASSSDGGHFKIDEAQVLKPSYEGGPFDAMSLLYPSHIDDLLYFSAFDGRRIRIGRAKNFAVSPTTPVLDVSA